MKGQEFDRKGAIILISYSTVFSEHSSLRELTKVPLYVSLKDIMSSPASAALTARLTHHFDVAK